MSGFYTFRRDRSITRPYPGALSQYDLRHAVDGGIVSHHAIQGQIENDWAKKLKKMERRLQRAEERPVDYELQVDPTQHLLNTRIEEIETARAALAESEQWFRRLADAAFEAIIIHAGEYILDCGEAAIRLYRGTKTQLLEKSFLYRISGTTEIRNHRWLYEQTEDPVGVIHVRMDGEKVPVEVRSRSITYKGVAALVTIIRDITTYKTMEQKFTQIANTDPLTGVGADPSSTSARRRCPVRCGSRSRCHC